MVLTETQTRAAYWLGCMPFRTWFTWRMYEDGGKRTEAEWHGLSVALGGSISAGFIALSSGLVKRESGVEAAKIWWQSLRPVHAVLWSVFTVMKAAGLSHAYVPLAIDTSLGLVAPFLLKPNFVNV